jgi:tRNA (Thr-GGU) A37 N-methylase
MMTKQTYQVSAVGRIKQEGGSGRIEIGPDFRAGLEGLDEFSHITVLWLFNRAAWDGNGFFHGAEQEDFPQAGANKIK